MVHNIYVFMFDIEYLPNRLKYIWQKLHVSLCFEQESIVFNDEHRNKLVNYRVYAPSAYTE